MFSDPASAALALEIFRTLKGVVSSPDFPAGRFSTTDLERDCLYLPLLAAALERNGVKARWVRRRAMASVLGPISSIVEDAECWECQGVEVGQVFIGSHGLGWREELTLALYSDRRLPTFVRRGGILGSQRRVVARFTHANFEDNQAPPYSWPDVTQLEAVSQALGKVSQHPLLQPLSITPLEQALEEARSSVVRHANDPGIPPAIAWVLKSIGVEAQVFSALYQINVGRHRHLREHAWIETYGRRFDIFGFNQEEGRSCIEVAPDDIFSRDETQLAPQWWLTGLREIQPEANDFCSSVKHHLSPALSYLASLRHLASLEQAVPGGQSVRGRRL